MRHEARAGATYRAFLKLASLELGLPEEQCEPVIGAVLRALEQRLPYDEMYDLASQLPDSLRELLASCENPGELTARGELGQLELLAVVDRELQVGADQAETYARAVFRLLAQTISKGEIEGRVAPGTWPSRSRIHCPCPSAWYPSC